MATDDIIATIDDFKRRKAKYAPIAARLFEVYGRIDWQRDQSPVDELISCVLSQSTTDTNRDRGFAALKARYGSWADVHHAPPQDVIDTIRSAGLANQKGPRIQGILGRVYAERGAYNIDFLADLPIDAAKTWLESLDGVGPKTAAIVLCFAFGRPAFPVDTHIHRVSRRVGFIPDTMSAEKAHPVMEAIVPPEKYYEFHIQLIQHGRETCQARSPRCERCPLTEYCDYYAATTPRSR